MYQLVTAYGLSRSIGAQWAEVDLSNILVHDIFTTFTKVYLVLSNPVLPENVNVDLDVLRSEYSSYNDTLDNLLILLDNRTLPTVASVPNTAVKFAKYSDAIRSKYKIKPANAGYNLPDNYPIEDLRDLEITRPTIATDMSLLHSHCLLSVNGFFHDTDTDGNKAYVYQGCKTLLKSKINHLGILSFLDIGRLTKVRLKTENIFAETQTDNLANKIFFSVDNDLENKSVLLVLGGYLVFPSENVFWQSGEKTFALNLKNLPYLERLFESSHYLDLSHLQLTTTGFDDGAYNLEEIWSDEVIRRYLTMSQTFLVIVDKPRMATNRIHLRHSNLPGMFTSYQDPTYPLFAGYGRAVEYWKTFEDGHWSVSVQDSFLRRFVVSEQPTPDDPATNDHLRPDIPFYNSRGFLLEISGWDQ